MARMPSLRAVKTLVRVRNAAVPQCLYAIRAALPRGATRREARRGLAALTITDDRRVDAGAEDVMGGRTWGCVMTFTNDR